MHAFYFTFWEQTAVIRLFVVKCCCISTWWLSGHASCLLGAISCQEIFFHSVSAPPPPSPLVGLLIHDPLFICRKGPCTRQKGQRTNILISNDKKYTFASDYILSVSFRSRSVWAVRKTSHTCLSLIRLKQTKWTAAHNPPSKRNNRGRAIGFEMISSLGLTSQVVHASAVKGTCGFIFLRRTHKKNVHIKLNIAICC